MRGFWTEELTDEEEEALIERIARQVKKRRLETPAILFLEMHKPVANVAAHAMVGFGPFIAPFVGFQNVDNFSQLLHRPGGLERLIRRIEARDPAPAEAGG